MTSDKKSTETASDGDLASKDGQSPEWANGLKQLYDSVVDEPLPDAFKDLLDKLDDVDSADDAPNAAEGGGDS
ncbi:NepR family anti-sigma factor [uncultured Erythrobacter sp.]|uniref:NepR family anti-sigma factor n=1 Tax=uncultured Erythrobacter sp. TaxID=263913 RepID=UPI00262B50A3|nr:NepR family anti-sigma factor [uncultured Erythrobacter sp.]